LNLSVRLFRTLAPLIAVAPVLAGPLDPAEFTARTITRQTLFDLRLSPEQTPQDMELVWYMLGMAERHAPKDEAIARLRLEAAFAMGDQEAVLEQTRRILLLDPDDEIAKLRLISNQIARRQTAEERLAIYEGLVGETGVKQAGLSPALRSRLALDAALLRQEQGDLDGFVRMLDTAIGLDATNKEAAALALAFYESSVDDPIGRLDLLANLLYADPVDPNVHDAIARDLAAGGAWAGAERFLGNEIAIGAAAGRPPDETIATNRLVLHWQRNGAESLLESLNQMLNVQRDYAERNIRMLMREQQPTDDQPRQDDVRLPAYQDYVRVLAAHASGDVRTLDAAMADYTRSAQAQVTSLRDPEVVGEDVSPEQIAALVAQILDQLTRVRLWTGRGLDDVEADLKALDEERAASGLEDESVTILAYRGWLALRRGDPAGALELFESCGEGFAFVEMGEALAQIEMGMEAEGVAGLSVLARTFPLSPLGAWSRTRVEAITGEPLVLSPHTERLVAWSRAIPLWLDRMALEPGRFITFQIENVEPTLQALERSAVRLRIRNTSRIPLAFGPSRPISSRIMLVARTDVGVENIGGGFEPEVFDIQRKLRINPLETVEVEIWPDPGETGFFLELVTSRTSRTRWRAVQGYTVTPDGIFQTGPMGLSDETNDVSVRLPLPETDHQAEELARRIREDDEATLCNLIGAVRVKIQEFVGLGAPMDQVADVLAPVLQAIVDRYPTCSPQTRLMMASCLQTEHFFPPIAPFEALVEADEDRDVRMMALFNRVTDPSDPLLEASLGDPDLARVAALVKQRLEDNRPMIAKMRARGRQPVQRPQGR